MKQGNTLLILTDAESRLIRQYLNDPVQSIVQQAQAADAFDRGVQRGTDKMTEESKVEWKARSKT